VYDDAFLARLKARDPDAQRVFYATELPLVRRACQHLLDGPALADQTAQDVLDDFLFIHVNNVRLGRALRGQLRGWTRTHCRKARRIQRRLGGETEAEPATVTPRFEFPQRLERLHRAVGELSEQQRRVVRLRFFDGLDNADIARRLGVSRPRITQLVSRALERLRAALPPEEV